MIHFSQKNQKFLYKRENPELIKARGWCWVLLLLNYEGLLLLQGVSLAKGTSRETTESTATSKNIQTSDRELLRGCLKEVLPRQCNLLKEPDYICNSGISWHAIPYPAVVSIKDVLNPRLKT